MVCHKAFSDGLPYEKRADGRGEPVCIEDEIPFEIPETWAWARLKSIFSMRAGKNIKGAAISQEMTQEKPYPCFGGNGVRGYVASANYSGDFPIIGRQGALCGNVHRARGTFYATEHAVVVTTFEGTDVSWACLFLEALKLNQYATATAQPGLAVSTIEGVLLPVPPLAEQGRIVAALDRCLSLVDTVERDGDELDALFRRLRSKVLDLAVRGELTERDPADEPAGELLARIHDEKLAMVARGELKPKDVKNDTVIFTGSDGLRYEKPADGRGEAVCIEDEIPFEIPETWTWARLGLISNYGRASSVKPTDIDEEDWVLDLEDIESGTGRLLKRVVKEERDASSSKRHFDTGEVLYGKLRPYLNKVLISDAPGYCSTEIMPIALYGQTDPTYILLCLMSDYFVEYANHCSYGMNMPRLGTKDGQRALIPIPPISEQTRIVQGVKAIRTVITNL